jgi:hypothetical protein
LTIDIGALQGGRGTAVAGMCSFWCLLRTRFLPKLAGNFQRVDADILPPQVFASRAVQLAVMAAAERDSEFIAHLAAERPLLGEADVVRVGRATSAHQAWLGRDEGEVGLVAVPAGAPIVNALLSMPLPKETANSASSGLAGD